MTFNFDSLKQITIKQWSVVSLGFLFLCYFLHTVLFPKVPYKIGTQKTLGLTDENINNELHTINLSNCKIKTSYTKLFRFRGNINAF